MIIAGVFVTDPALGYPPGAPAGLSETPSDHGSLHVLGALLDFAGLPAAAFVFSRRFATLAGRGGMRRYSLATAAVMLAFFVASTVAAGNDGLRSVAGLLQRASIMTGWSWIAVLALRTMREEPTI
jgi:hypothetical protein